MLIIACALTGAGLLLVLVLNALAVTHYWFGGGNG